MTISLKDCFLHARGGKLPSYVRVVSSSGQEKPLQRVRGRELFFDHADHSWHVQKIGRHLPNVPPEVVLELENCFVNSKGVILSPTLQMLRGPKEGSEGFSTSQGSLQIGGDLLGSHVFGLHPKTSFGHWLLHRLPQIFSSFSNHETRDVIVSSSSWDPLSLLESLGVESKRVTSLPMERPELFFRVEKLIVSNNAAPPGKSRLVDWKRLEKMVRFMSKRVSHVSRESPKKVYLTRTQKSGNRSGCQNRELIEKSFVDLGFFVVAPEEYSFSEQIGILRGARHIAVEAGSASLLSIFSPDLESLTYLAPQAPYRIADGTALYAPFSRAATILRRSEFRYASIAKSSNFSEWTAEEHLLRAVVENF